MSAPLYSGMRVAPHAFKQRRGLVNRIRGICNHCYAPKSLHPRFGHVRARPLNDNRYVSANAPHFNEGW